MPQGILTLMKMTPKTNKDKIKSDYYLHPLHKENDLNKILRAQRKAPTPMRILFTSLWDDHSNKLVEELKEKEVDSTKKYPLYVVDSYNMPHSFVIYKTSKVPQLVKLERNRVAIDDYLPRIRTLLGV